MRERKKRQVEVTKLNGKETEPGKNKKYAMEKIAGGEILEQQTSNVKKKKE